ncbi:hypothetical protein EKH57_17990 (plasmid) [Halorubrum sp. BOL3-1]|uniref:hypothetical protein n=1 Tax=Halorubrum sp. BOL3-1 TaxID=2497325 RepID=UPI00100515DE|nr:hypothetical protein [Halorubrum sp. BOL3-1]QAU14561.1 hypothetical protein EKH57_17990 [Halorubrum sp. BOL3-1]
MPDVPTNSQDLSNKQAVEIAFDLLNDSTRSGYSEYDIFLTLLTDKRAPDDVIEDFGEGRVRNKIDQCIRDASSSSNPIEMFEDLWGSFLNEIMNKEETKYDIFAPIPIDRGNVSNIPDTLPAGDIEFSRIAPSGLC